MSFKKIAPVKPSRKPAHKPSRKPDAAPPKKAVPAKRRPIGG